MSDKTVFFNRCEQTIELTEKASGTFIPGLSEKSLYTDGESTYVVKSVKPRSIKDIFGSDYVKFFSADTTYRLKILLPEVDGQIITRLLTPCINIITSVAIGTEKESVIEDIINEVLTCFLSAVNPPSEKTTKVRALLQQVIFNLIDHVVNTLINFMHTEIIGPKIAKAIWKDNMVVPETYYPSDINMLTPKIISKWLEQPFDEFVQTQLKKYYKEQISLHQDKALIVQNLKQMHTDSLIEIVDPSFEEIDTTNVEQIRFNIKHAKFWHASIIKAPTLYQLGFNAAQKTHLGNLFAVALVTGHYDILNNISGTNSGIVAGTTCCVDWGNSFDIGFGGLSKAESYAARYSAGTGHMSLESCYPYMGVVNPDLPRMLIPDIFDLNDPHIASGFRHYIELAHRSIPELKKTTASIDMPQLLQKPLRAIYGDSFVIDTTIQRIEQLYSVLQSCSDMAQFKHELRMSSDSIIRDSLSMHLQDTTKSPAAGIFYRRNGLTDMPAFHMRSYSGLPMPNL